MEVGKPRYITIKSNFINVVSLGLSTLISWWRKGWYYEFKRINKRIGKE